MAKRLFILSLLISSAYSAKLTVHLDNPAHEISPELFGIFVEEINHGLDGGECVNRYGCSMIYGGTERKL